MPAGCWLNRLISCRGAAGPGPGMVIDYLRFEIAKWNARH